MAFFRKHLRHILVFLALAIVLIPGNIVRADDESPHEPLEIATILHPPLDEPVAPLDSLILIKIDAYYVGDTFFYLILLDDHTIPARWDSDSLTFSYFPDRMLENGEHSIKVYMTEVGGAQTQLVTSATFNVGGGRTAPGMGQGSLFDLGRTPGSPPPPPVTGRTTSDFFSLSGRSILDINFVNLDGTGSALRQEPENTSIFSLYGRGRDDRTDFDFRFFVTSDETRFQQPRNRYLFNVEQPDYGISLGDTTPRLNPLLLDGLRVRGASGWVDINDLSLYIATGESRRETDTRYRDNGQIWSTGMGQQDLFAGRLALWEDNPFSIGLTYLHGNEGESDLEGRGYPGDNQVQSADFLWRFDSDNGSLRGIWAESQYDYDDPDTDDLSGENAYLLESTYRMGDHTLKAKWERIDPGFISLGRTSLQKDRESIGAEDSFNIGRGDLTGRLYIEQFENNLNDQLDFTTVTNRYGGQIRYRFALRGPTITLGVNFQDRSNDALEGETGWLSDDMTSYTAGIAQPFDWLGAQHNVRVDWRANDRSSLSSPTSDSDQDTITVSMTSRWPEGFQLYLLYGNTDSDYPSSERFTDVDRYSARLSYSPPSGEFETWSGYEAVRSDGNQATYNSDRDTLEFGLNWRLGGDMSLEASMKFMEFDDMANDANDFEETTFRIMLVQLLN